MEKVSEEEAIQLIADVVMNHQGCKALTLAAQIAGYNEMLGFSSDEIANLIDKAIKEGMILEIEYVLPNMPYRAKSFLLPKGTEVKLS